jgi:hypothetical protein
MIGGKYDQYISHACMQIEQWNSFKLSYKKDGEGEMRKSNRRGE